MDLVPAFIKTHWHCANEWLDACRALVVGGSESAPNVLVIEHLDFKGKVFFQLTKVLGMRQAKGTYILDDHDKERKFDTQGFVSICRASDKICGNISAHDL